MPEKLPYVRTLIYALRMVAGIFIIALLLYAASQTTRDCTVGLYVFDLCSWVWLREQLGLPASKFLGGLSRTRGTDADSRNFLDHPVRVSLLENKHNLQHGGGKLPAPVEEMALGAQFTIHHQYCPIIS